MIKLRLPRDGAEYAHFTFSPAILPEGAVLEAQVGSGPWTQLETPANAVPRLLLKGPDAPGGTAGVLVAADAPLRVRVRDDPEVIVRGAGQIVLVRA